MLVLAKPLLLWINDLWMAVFFFLVGLELKRELMVGELSSPRQVMLPAGAALGGMLIPALIYAAINAGDSIAMRGWGIPMATDIAFALGVLVVLGSRVPLSLKILLTAVAIVDDMGAILVIAFFCTANLSLDMLVAAIGPYVMVGLVVWVLVLTRVKPRVWVCVVCQRFQEWLASAPGSLGLGFRAGLGLFFLFLRFFLACRGCRSCRSLLRGGRFRRGGAMADECCQ